MKAPLTTHKAGFGAIKPGSGAVGNVERSCKTVPHRIQKRMAFSLQVIFFLPLFSCIAKKENVIDTENHHLRGSLCVCERDREKL